MEMKRSFVGEVKLLRGGKRAVMELDFDDEVVGPVVYPAGTTDLRPAQQ